MAIWLAERMEGLVLGALLVDSEVDVLGGHADRVVAEQVFENVEIEPGFVKMSRISVPEAVWSETAADGFVARGDAQLLGVLLDDA